MAASDKVFAGSIPEIYDRFLVSLIFKSCARDLAARLARTQRAKLRKRRRTGCSRGSSHHSFQEARIVATDLNQPMLDLAAAKQGDASRVEWRLADALALPFGDQSFDAVACQFGVMFFPDKVQGYREARRMLRTGGRFCFKSGTRSPQMSSPMSSRRPWRRCFRRTRRGSWPGPRTAITTRKRSDISWRGRVCRDLNRGSRPKRAAPRRRAIRRSPIARAPRCATKSRTRSVTTRRATKGGRSAGATIGSGAIEGRIRAMW